MMEYEFHIHHVLNSRASGGYRIILGFFTSGATL